MTIRPATEFAGGRTPAELTADLVTLGVRPGDLLMVHVSLRRIGPVVGGADGVVDALLATVGADGTVLVNVGVADDGEPFAAERTPSDPDNGVFAEVFRRRAVVSDHPEGRLGAIGPGATALLSDVPWDDYYGPGSPLERLVDDGGRVVLLGSDLEHVTLIHLAEYYADVPTKRRVTRQCKVATPAGVVDKTVSCLDDSDGIVEWDGPDYFGLIVADYLRSETAHRGRVGNAESVLIEAPDLVTHATAWMEGHLT